MVERFQGADITYLGHATVLIEMSGTKIITDPVFRDRLWFLKRDNARHPFSHELDGIDAVVLSHMHFDHMDYPSLRAIPRETPIIAPRGARRYLRNKVPHEVIEMEEGDALKLGGVTVNATPSNHESGFYWPFWFPTSVLSFLFEGSQTVYFVGDTALFDSMVDLGRNYNIDTALLPVWGFGPYIRGDHMSPAEAATALSALSPRTAIPIHWGTLRPMGPVWRKMSFLTDPPLSFSVHAARFAPETEVRVLNPGERTIIWGTPSRS
jgi:L-ascorbate metabolism protein UlaG (beta-lactamase superfamily)